MKCTFIKKSFVFYVRLETGKNSDASMTTKKRRLETYRRGQQKENEKN